MNEAAVRFQSSLQSFDPLLSLRWGPTVQQWVIQRKSLIPDSEMIFLRNERARSFKRLTPSSSEKERTRFAGIAEEHDSALQGCRVILFINAFNAEVFNTLALGDIKRYGGYSRYTDKQDELIAQQEAIKEKERENQRAIIHGESWGRRGIYDFLMRKKQTDIHQFGIRDMRTLLGADVFKDLRK